MHFTELLTTTRRIFSNYSFPESVLVFLSYLRIVIRNRLPFVQKNKESFLSFTFTFPNRAHFFSMFSDIFFRSVYQLPQGKVTLIIDAGSNIGLSVLYFRWRQPQARILCFEPNPEAFALLKNNIENNSITGIEMYPYALGGEGGVVDLFTGSTMEADNSATTFSAKNSEGSPSKSVRVEMRQLSGFVTEPVDFLKLDIEGGEGVVLEELERSNKLALVARMAIEFHIYENRESYPLGKFLSILDRNNFRYVCNPSFSDIESPSKKGMRTYIIYAKRLG